MVTTTTIDLGPLSRELGMSPERVETVIRLLDEGNTVPFITRYRKDQTGGLDEVQIRDIEARVNKLRQLVERKQTILRSIETQGKLTPELTNLIQSADSLKRLEDLYLPYKPKKQTLATTARERGLEPFAEEILAASPACVDLGVRAKDFINPDKQITSVADVLLGVGHILAETFSERADVRGRLRRIFKRSGKLISNRIETEKKAEPVESKPAESKPIETKAVETKSVEVVAEVARETVQDVVSPVEPVAVTHLEVSQTEIPPVAPPMMAHDDAADYLPVSSAEPAAEVLSSSETPAVESSSTESVATGEPTTLPAPEVAATRPNARAEFREKKKQAKEKAKTKLQEKLEHDFRDYFSYQEQLGRIPPHRILAINRGEKAKILRVKIDADTDAMSREADSILIPPEHPHAEFLRGCAKDALSRLVEPSLEREIRRELTDHAETHAVEVFARNLRNLLLQPPIGGRRVLAIDPGFKSGCKLAALDEFGNLLDHSVVHIIGKDDRKKEARAKIVELIQKHNLNVAAIGNGTACRETEDIFNDLLANELKDQGAAYVIVNEAGASVYSTSPLGREEFPNFDATLRGAISIGRRLLDPLSELVKIDPASIGVGLYQHDVKAKHLQTSLDAVIESCVNYVGVDINTASPALLRYVSGLNQLTARRVYDHRQQHGPFLRREQLRDVPGIGEAGFVQAAGFLKITGGENPLDATWIHPESYEAAGKVLEKLNCSAASLAEKETAALLTERSQQLNPEEVATELHVGTLLLKDILAQLSRPGRDPREDLPQPIFKRGVLKLEDLSQGIELTGSVLNVVDFGAFVDIGLHDSGLVHISQLANKYVRDPHDVVAVGDIVKVWVLEIDKTRRRVSLTMIAPGTPRTPPPHPAESERRPPDRRRSDNRPPRPARPATSGEGAAAGQNSGGQTQQSGRPPRPSGQGGGGQGGGYGRRPQRGGRSDGPDKPRFTPPPPPKPKPLVPITKKMVIGKEPMRTFGDLFQFAKIKAGEELPETVVAPKKPEKKPPKPKPAESTPPASNTPEQTTNGEPPPVAPTTEHRASEAAPSEHPPTAPPSADPAAS